MIEVVDLREKFGLFGEHWRPKIVGEVNGSYVKLAKVKGEFVWHRHANEDELFLVIRGTQTGGSTRITRIRRIFADVFLGDVAAQPTA